MSVQDKVLMRKIKKREKQKLKLLKIKEAEKVDKSKFPILIISYIALWLLKYRKNAPKTRNLMLI